MCPTCSSLLSRADNGRVNEFTCAYHGWEFNLDGQILVEDEEHEGRRSPSMT